MTKPAKPKEKRDLLNALTECAGLLSNASLPKSLKPVLIGRFVKICNCQDDLFTRGEETGNALTVALSQLIEQIQVLEKYSEQGVI